MYCTMYYGISQNLVRVLVRVSRFISRFCQKPDSSNAANQQEQRIEDDLLISMDHGSHYDISTTKVSMPTVHVVKNIFSGNLTKLFQYGCCYAAE